MLYLASKSPRRAKLLEQIQVDYSVLAVEIDETQYPDESPATYVQRLAVQKAQAGQKLQPNATILAADTIVVYRQNVLGKPTDAFDAARMLNILSANTHRVFTAIAVQKQQRCLQKLNITQVKFKPLSQQEIQAYIATGEYIDKAGSYAIQGLAALFIERITGSYSGVMGLPLYEVGELLQLDAYGQAPSQ
jgi:septum formation protein